MDADQEPGKKQRFDRQQRFHAWYFVAAIMGIILLQQLWSFGQTVQIIPYSEFLNDLRAGKIESVQVSGTYIEGRWKQPVNGKRTFMTTRVPLGGPLFRTARFPLNRLTTTSVRT